MITVSARRRAQITKAFGWLVGIVGVVLSLRMMLYGAIEGEAGNFAAEATYIGGGIGLASITTNILIFVASIPVPPKEPNDDQRIDAALALRTDHPAAAQELVRRVPAPRVLQRLPGVLDKESDRS